MSTLGTILAKVAGFIDPATGELVRAPDPRSLDWMMARTPKQRPDELWLEQLPQVMGESTAYDYAKAGDDFLEEPLKTYMLDRVEFSPFPQSVEPAFFKKGVFMTPEEAALTGGNIYLGSKINDVKRSFGMLPPGAPDPLYPTHGIGPNGELLTKPPLPGEY